MKRQNTGFELQQRYKDDLKRATQIGMGLEGVASLRFKRELVWKDLR